MLSFGFGRKAFWEHRVRPGAGRRRAGAASPYFQSPLSRWSTREALVLASALSKGRGRESGPIQEAGGWCFLGQTGSPAGRFTGRGRGEVRRLQASFVRGNGADANVAKIQKAEMSLDCLHLQVVAKVPWGMGDFSSWGTFSRCDASSLSRAESWRMIGERCGARVSRQLEAGPIAARGSRLSNIITVVKSIEHNPAVTARKFRDLL